MVLNSYGLSPPGTIVELLRPIEIIDDAHFDQFLAELGHGGYHIVPIARLRKVAETLDVSIDDAELLLGILKRIYDRFRELESKGAEFDALFLDFLRTGLEIIPDENGRFNERQSLVDRLADLFARNTSIDEGAKVSALEKGFSDLAVGFSTMLELRPNYSADRTQIFGYVPIVQLRINTDSGMPTKQQLIVAMNGDGLESLKNAVADIEKKLETLANQPLLSDKLSGTFGNL